VADEKLVERFNAALDKLHSLTRKHGEFSMSVLLHQLINQNADDITMRRLIDEMDKEIVKWQKPQE